MVLPGCEKNIVIFHIVSMDSQRYSARRAPARRPGSGIRKIRPEGRL